MGQGPHEEIMAGLAKQSMRHKLFHSTPQLDALLQTAQSSIPDAFLAYAANQRLTMNWTTHIHLLNWLCREPVWQPRMTSGMIRELLMAAVIRWSLTGLDHVTVKGIMVVSRHLPSEAVGLWKSMEADKGSKVVFLRLPEACNEDKYALSYTDNCWKDVIWQPLL
ncbi:hypothetical protein AQULUS_04940 [Aquicella lusitana]|uniref:Methanobactin biosynthesis cassette protein MbnC n=2 Tax=Aquicella lusitana TaxID=254246 RepID=A0A370GN62_9COXI|nr:hypothetical protein C8D86_10736 [Aquicella lusitana]VVC72772.1 hypothetical protein AQULUS_04940 [Aquicella lusitana]